LWQEMDARATVAAAPEEEELDDRLAEAATALSMMFEAAAAPAAPPTARGGAREAPTQPLDESEAESGDMDVAPRGAGRGGRWTEQEHATFLTALEKYGRSWKTIQPLIPTRSVEQVRMAIFPIKTLSLCPAKRAPRAAPAPAAAARGGGCSWHVV
jgi:SHAQKYF class myb-like DNA-binding protein